MITPVDFRQKSFRTGIGYDKKDVDSFMVELLRNYEELYRSNAQQIAEIKDLSDNLIRYKAMEESLNRELMVAEKTSEELIQEATDKAKKIEADAKTKAKQLLKTAKEDLAFTHQQTIGMAQMYASMKTQLNLLFKNFVDVTNSEDLSIDIDELEAFGAVSDDIKDAINASEVVPKMNFAASAYIPTMPMPGGKGSQGAGAAFGSFEGDPQMRDESPLSGMTDGGATVEGKFGDISTAGFGFSSLVENESYKDPFAGINVKSTNEFDDRMSDPFGQAAAASQSAVPKKTKKKAPQQESAPAYEEPANTEAASGYAAPEYDAPEYDAPDYSSVDSYESAEYQTSSEAGYAEQTEYTATAYSDSEYSKPDYPEADIPTVNFEADDYSSTDEDLEDLEDSDALSGEVDEKPAGPRLIGDGDGASQDFEFV